MKRQGWFSHGYKAEKRNDGRLAEKKGCGLEVGSRGEKHASRGRSDTRGHRAQLLRGRCSNQQRQADAGPVPTPWTVGDQTNRGYQRVDSPKPS